MEMFKSYWVSFKCGKKTTFEALKLLQNGTIILQLTLFLMFSGSQYRSEKLVPAESLFLG